MMSINRSTEDTSEIDFYKVSNNQLINDEKDKFKVLIKKWLFSTMYVDPEVYSSTLDLIPIGNTFILRRILLWQITNV